MKSHQIVCLMFVQLDFTFTLLSAGCSHTTDPILSPIPQSSVAAAVRKSANPQRAHQHPQCHGRSEKTQAKLLK